MKRKLQKTFFAALMLAHVSLFAQVQTIDFTNLSLQPDTFWNGADGSQGFNSGNAYFRNAFFDYGGGMTVWDGFAYSNKVNDIDQNFTNQFSTYAGALHPGGIFAVSFLAADWSTYELKPNYIKFTNPASPLNIKITNNTYAGLTILNGDGVSKKFGGVNGDDPDYFKLMVYGMRNGQNLDTLDFYLADFRFTDNNDDYIIKDWTNFDLSSLGVCDSLGFLLESTDNGSFGMNTPAYFCISSITIDVVSHISNNQKSITNQYFWPNPASENILINENVNSVTIFDLAGRRIMDSSNKSIDISLLPKSAYIIEIELNDLSRKQEKLLIQ